MINLKERIYLSRRSAQDYNALFVAVFRNVRKKNTSAFTHYQNKAKNNSFSYDYNNYSKDLMRIVDTRYGSFLKKVCKISFLFKKESFSGAIFLTESNFIVGMGEKLHESAEKMRQRVYQ